MEETLSDYSMEALFRPPSPVETLHSEIDELEASIAKLIEDITMLSLLQNQLCTIDVFSFSSSV